MGIIGGATSMGVVYAECNNCAREFRGGLTSANMSQWKYDLDGYVPLIRQTYELNGTCEHLHGAVASVQKRSPW